MSVLLALGACSNDKKEVDKVDEELKQLLVEYNVLAKPEEGIEIPAIDSPVAQLGMQLFYSKALSGNKDTACVTCHHPLLGGGDRLALPIGVDAKEHDFLGPGRLHSESGFHHDGGPTVPRNAPTTFNLALYKKAIFHDGRLEMLPDTTIRSPDSAFNTTDVNAINLAQSQAMFPVTSPEEMRGQVLEGDTNTAIRTHLVNRLVSQEIGNSWLEEFQTAFNSNADAQTLITMANISMAIGEYERSQLFVDNAWRRYVQGDDNAISASAKAGAITFYKPVSEGGAGCASCHSGDFFTDESYHAIAIPQLGRGKGDGEFGDDDFGRMRETKLADDKYAFRTPTLLNVEVTLPYGHSGAYADLESVVRHHLNPQQAVENYDFTSLDLQQGMQVTNAKFNSENSVEFLTQLQASNKSLLKNVDLSDEQVEQVVEFLKTLTDPCVKDDQCLSPWIPSDDSANPDSLRLVPSNYITSNLD